MRRSSSASLSSHSGQSPLSGTRALQASAHAGARSSWMRINRPPSVAPDQAGHQQEKSRGLNRTKNLRRQRRRTLQSPNRLPEKTQPSWQCQISPQYICSEFCPLVSASHFVPQSSTSDKAQQRVVDEFFALITESVTSKPGSQQDVVPQRWPQVRIFAHTLFR